MTHHAQSTIFFPHGFTPGVWQPPRNKGGKLGALSEMEDLSRHSRNGFGHGKLFANFVHYIVPRVVGITR